METQRYTSGERNQLTKANVLRQKLTNQEQERDRDRKFQKRYNAPRESERERERELNEIAKTKSGAPEVRRGWQGWLSYSQKIPSKHFLL